MIAANVSVCVIPTKLLSYDQLGTPILLQESEVLGIGDVVVGKTEGKE